jgi:C2 domain
MDPCVVISFGKKVFRTRVIRHSRNPVWDEKLLFHVRRYEIGFKVSLFPPLPVAPSFYCSLAVVRSFY